MNAYNLYYFAQAYGEGTYSSSTYSTQTTTGTGTGSGSGTGTSGGGVLSNTGFDIAAAITLACVIVFAALIIRFWKRPNRQTVAETVEDK